MKKYFFIAALSIFCLTGCGEKTLTCTKSEQDDVFSMEEKIILKFDKSGEKIKSGSFNATFEISDEYTDYMDDMVDMINSNFEDLNDIGIEPKVEKKDNKVNVEINYKVNSLSEDELNELYYTDLYYDDNFDGVKAAYEENEYTCK